MGNMEESLLKIFLGGHRISLESGTNLDSYTEEGKYRAPTDAIARSCNNSPTNAGFIMNIYNGIYSSVQQIIPFYGGTIYMRRYQRSQGSWTGWYKYTGELIELD